MPHPDFQALVDSLLPFAKSLLSEHGDFHPFGAIMASDGAIQWIAADTGEEFPSAQILIEAMTELIKDKAASEEIRAATICYNAVTIPPGEVVKTDVIGFSVEQRSGESVSIFLPYVKRETGHVDYRDMFAFEKTNEFFSSSMGVDEHRKPCDGQTDGNRKSCGN